MNAPGPSARLRRAAEQERRQLARTRNGLKHRLAQLLTQVATIQAELQQIAAVDERLQDLAPNGPQSPAAKACDNGVAQTCRLGGRELRVRAVRELLLARGAHEPTHYRAWLEILKRAGCTASGQDPAATLLANLCRSPVVVATRGPGMYLIAPERRDMLRAHLADRKERLGLLLNEPALTPEGLQRRNGLVRAIGRLEDQLAEADDALEAERVSEPRGGVRDA